MNFLAVACPECRQDVGDVCLDVFEPHPKRVEAALEWQESFSHRALDHLASFIAAADPIMAAYGFEVEGRNLDTGWAHWIRDESCLAFRLVNHDWYFFRIRLQGETPKSLHRGLKAAGWYVCRHCGRTTADPEHFPAGGGEISDWCWSCTNWSVF